MAYNGTVLVNLSGKRKPTVYRCNACSAAAGTTVWHRTARGIDPEECPLSAVGHPVGHSAVQAASVAPAVIVRAPRPARPSVED